MVRSRGKIEFFSFSKFLFPVVFITVMLVARGATLGYGHNFERYYNTSMGCTLWNQVVSGGYG